VYCYSSQCSRKLTLGAKVSLGVSPPARAAKAEFVVRQERPCIPLLYGILANLLQFFLSELNGFIMVTQLLGRAMSSALRARPAR